MAGEFPITIVMLTLTGIASHNLYRTLLWQDGADNGFNSAPNEALYAAANYRPFTAPMVWSGLYVIAIHPHELIADPNSITNYNLVLGVLSTFFLIVKLPVHWMHLFYPPVAVSIHASLIILYLVSAIYQGGSDTSDPKHSQSGPPWYITKSCSVAYRKSNIPYCMQAKALFAVTILMMYATLSLTPIYAAMAHVYTEANMYQSLLCSDPRLQHPLLFHHTRRARRDRGAERRTPH